MSASPYSFGPENRMISAMGANAESYVYDAIGRRVKLTNNGGARLYFYDLGGHPMTATDSGGNRYRSEIYLGEMHLATYANSKTYFSHTSLIGTTRVITDEQGAVNNNCTYWPFGDWQSCSNGTPITPIGYAGYEHDPETGMDHMWFRYYNSRLGRFMSADPLGGNIGDSQSLNRFAYVLNNPANLIDPLGLDATCTTSPEGKTTCFTNVNEPGPNDGNRTLENVEAEVGRLPLCGSGGGDVCALILDFLNGNFGLGGTGGGGLDILATLVKFFRGRRPGQGFSDCVKTNIQQLSFGAIDLHKINDQVVPAIIEAGTVASALAGTAARDPNTGIKLSVATIALLHATQMAGLSGSARAGTVRSGVILLRGAAIAAAASVGAVIGSSANCAAEGIN